MKFGQKRSRIEVTEYDFCEGMLGEEPLKHTS